MLGLEKRYWRLGVPTILAIFAFALIASILTAAISDPIADRELGQGDFVHSTSPSFVRARSLNLHEGITRANMIAIDLQHDRLYVADRTSNRVLGWSSASGFLSGSNADIVIGAPVFLRFRIVQVSQPASADRSDSPLIRRTEICSSPMITRCR